MSLFRIKIEPIFLCVFLILQGISTSVFSSSEVSITFGVNDSPPYWVKSPEKKGMGEELIDAISMISGIQAKIVFQPLQRLINDDANNDLGNPVFYMETQDFSSIIPIAIYSISFTYYRPNHEEEIIINDFNDLKKYKVGILQGVLTDTAYFQKAGIFFEASYSQASLVKKLRHGRIDLFIEIDLVAKKLIETLYADESDKFKTMNISNSVSPIAIMIDENQANGDIIGNKIRFGLKKIIENGLYNKIVKAYYDNGELPKNWHENLMTFQKLYAF